MPPRHPQPPLAIRGIGEAGPDVLQREIGKLLDDLLRRHSAARYSSTSRTVIRKPRMHACPLRLSGSSVIKCEYSIIQSVSRRDLPVNVHRVLIATTHEGRFVFFAFFRGNSSFASDRTAG